MLSKDSTKEPALRRQRWSWVASGCFGFLRYSGARQLLKQESDTQCNNSAPPLPLLCRKLQAKSHQHRTLQQPRNPTPIGLRASAPRRPGQSLGQSFARAVVKLGKKSKKKLPEPRFGFRLLVLSGCHAGLLRIAARGLQRRCRVPPRRWQCSGWCCTSPGSFKRQAEALFSCKDVCFCFRVCRL